MASQTLTGQNSFRTVVRALGASAVSTALGVARSSHASLRSTIKQGRPFGLHPPHRVAGTDPVVLTQDLDVLGMPLWILRQHLQPRRGEAVPRRDLLRAVVAERVSELPGLRPEGRLLIGMRAVPTAGRHQPEHAVRMPHADVQRRETTHRVADEERFVRPDRIQDDDIRSAARLRSRIDRRLRATTGRNETRGQVPQNVT